MERRGIVHLVVGANGFLGRSLAERLLAAKQDVSGVIGRKRDRVPVGLPVSPDLAGAPDPDVVYIAAAFIPHGAMDAPDARLWEANVALVQRVHERWPGARLVLASSVAVYGDAPGVRTEDTVSTRPSLYGLSKLAGELPARLHGSYAILRFSSLVGPGMDPRTFVPRAVEQARRDRRIVLFGDGSRRADYLHVEDAVDLCLVAGASGENGTFLGAFGVSSENRAIAEHVASRVPGTTLAFTGSDSSPSVEYDPSRTRARLGFRPRRTVLQAAEELCDHA